MKTSRSTGILTKPLTTVETFSRRFTIQDSGCWNWDKPHQNGYGRFTITGFGSMLAHRVSYELFAGTEAKKGDWSIDHLCRNRTCVNPKHLEEVPLGENVLRGLAISSQNKSKTHCAAGHEFTPENTYLKNGHRGCRKCMRAWVKEHNKREEAKFADKLEIACKGKILEDMTKSELIEGIIYLANQLKGIGGTDEDYEH